MSFMALLVFTPNCKKETDFTKYTDSSASQFAEKDIIVLGEQLENPYSVENMQIAYNQLKNTEDGDSLEATHLYIRYLAQNENEHNELLTDENLELFDYPLDYEMEEGGISHHDSNLPDSAITWQYTVVEVGYVFKEIQHETISELFIPELIEEESGAFNESFVRDLVYKSLELTNNLKSETTSQHGAEAVHWYPSGVIQVHDDVAGIIPLEGAKVRARSWFIIRKDYTNEDGHFQTGKTLTDVTYSIKWENRYYDIRDGALPQAYFRGPKNRDPWNLDIVSGKSLRFATIHRAAYRYNYKNIGGLKRPNIWTRLKIVYKDGEGTGVNWGTHWQRFVLAPAGIQLFPNIKLWGKRDHPTLGIIYRNTNDLYSTTIHELAHTSHIDLLKFGTIQYIATSGIMRESWPNAVEWHITKIEYNELGFSNYDDPNLNTLGDHMQHKKYPQTDPKNNKYTPLFIDLVDDYNQSLERYSSTLSQTNCPYGGTWDGAGCLIETAPPGETASIIGDDFYYTPVGCCSCPTSGANLTGTGCLVTHIHNKAIPFVVDFTKMYYNPIGDSEYPNDEIAGYSMPYLENYIVPVSINLTAYRIALKIVKPANVTNKKIDVFTDYFVGL